jgi:hypothetical protein
MRRGYVAPMRWMVIYEYGTQTIVTMGILPYQGKIPMVEPGIKPGTSCLVVRNADHYTTRLVSLYMFQALFAHHQEALHTQQLVYFVCIMSAVNS